MISSLVWAWIGSPQVGSRHAQAGVEDAQEIVDFGHRAHCGARIFGHGLLLQEMAGVRPSMRSMAGLSIWGRNWRA